MWKMETFFPTEADGFMFIYSPKNTAFWKKKTVQEILQMKLSK